MGVWGGGVSGCNLGDRLESVLAEGQGLIWAKGSSQCGWMVRVQSAG